MSAPSLSTTLANPWSETPSSRHEAARARDEAELHATQRSGAVRVIAGAAKDAADARALLEMLGLGVEDILAAHPMVITQPEALDTAAPTPPKRARKSHAA